jgi:phytoene dehydrogenase-like protein
LNATALRLTTDQSGRARGVELLTGETVEASRAIVSNLTVWDTYGKLVGLNGTPTEIKQRLSKLTGWGAYLVFLGIDEEVAEKLTSNTFVTLSDWQLDTEFDPEETFMAISCAPAPCNRAPTGKRAVTISTFTEPTQWFSYHEDEAELEEKDSRALNSVWNRLQRTLPELGSEMEVIETMTPREYYDLTRRKLGMVGGMGQSVDVFGTASFSHQTSIPNLFMVGDSTFPGNGVAAVSQSALIVANEIAPLRS